MEIAPVKKLSRKEWRRLVKKERRKRVRQREARARDEDAKRLKDALERSAGYLTWLAIQRTDEENRAAKEAEEHAEREQQWLEEEVKAQQAWRIVQDKKAKARQEQLEQEERIRREFEAKQEALRLKREEAKRREEEEEKKRLEIEREIDNYIDEGTSTPPVLRTITNSQPGKELCPFFSKTGACRYGEACSRNHQRVSLSRVILVPAFYSHFSLEKNSAEYDTDIALEFESSERRHHFREFYNDVVPELEKFGRIKTLKYCCNAEIHLRGNLYVEYYSEREAAGAVRGLNGRWYAGRQLNCDFANVKSWRNAVCGMQRCPKGRSCNFLHTFRNPRDEYDIVSPPRSRKRRASSQERSVSSSQRTKESSRSGRREPREESAKDWKWSDSPESGSEASVRSWSETGSRSSRQESKRLRNRMRHRRRREREWQSRSERESNNEKSREDGDNSWDTPIRVEGLSSPRLGEEYRTEEDPKRRERTPRSRHSRNSVSERRVSGESKEELEDGTDHKEEKDRKSKEKSRHAKHDRRTDDKRSSRRRHSGSGNNYSSSKSKWDATVSSRLDSDSDTGTPGPKEAKVSRNTSTHSANPDRGLSEAETSRSSFDSDRDDR